MRQRFVVVMSIDEYNTREGARPVCMDVETVREPRVGVALTEADPAELQGAVISVSSLAERDPSWLGEPIGMVSGATLAAVHDRLATLLDMPR
jgi:mRNA-degrading endonuclease toxin of MazEF toxin-antitoxin module